MSGLNTNLRVAPRLGKVYTSPSDQMLSVMGFTKMPLSPGSAITLSLSWCIMLNGSSVIMSLESQATP